MEVTSARAPDVRSPRDRWVAVAALGYFAAYVGYLFVHREGELGHWLTLVLLPLLLVRFAERPGPPDAPGWTRAGGYTSSLAGIGWSAALSSAGLRRGKLTEGILMAAVVGLLLGGVQVLLSARREAIWELLGSPRVLIALPATLLLLLTTAAFTEEFFFRGMLQSRLARWFRSDAAAVIATAVLFGLYHLPYAYLNPRWPSHGNLEAAFVAAMGQGVAGGLVLGLVFVRARGNLVAPVLTHACINLLPGMVHVERMLRGLSAG